MKRTSITFVLLLLVLANPKWAGAAKQNSEKASLTGVWQCLAHGSVQGDVPFTLTLHQDGENVTGTIATADGELQISSGSFKNRTLEIHSETEDARYVVTGGLEAQQLKGHWSKTAKPGAGDGQGGDQEGQWEGKRSAPAKSSAP